MALHPDEDDHKPPVPQFYCTFSLIIEDAYDYTGEIALAGILTPPPSISEFLITAGAGDYNFEGSLTSELMEDKYKTHEYIVYHLNLIE